MKGTQAGLVTAGCLIDNAIAMPNNRTLDHKPKLFANVS